MNKWILILVFTLSYILIFALDGEWIWAKIAGGTSTDYGYSISTDTSGNSYVTGSFNGVAHFGSTTLISRDSDDIFVAKIDNNGNWLWAKKAGGYYSDCGNSISTDAAGNSYITGSFKTSAIFGNFSMSSSGSTYPDIFIAKLDTNGNWLWAKKAGGYYYDKSYAISSDPSGNCFITGYFSGTAVFGTEYLYSYGSSDVYIAKMNTNGDWLWVKQAGGVYDDSGFGIYADEFSNCYVTGHYSLSVNFGDTNLSTGGSSDIFVTKLDANGNWLWAQTAGIISYTYGLGIHTDANANIYVTGRFYDLVNFGNISIESVGSGDVFVAKLDSNGNWLWAKQAGSTGFDTAYGISTDANGNCYITGEFSGSADFGSTTLTSEGVNDIFVARLDPAGNWLWAKKSGSTNEDFGNGISIDSNGNAFVTGYFYGNISFDNSTYSSNGSADIFISKISSIEHLLLAPNGGEEWQAGSMQTISWSLFNAGSEVNIFISNDNGANWMLLNSSPVPASLGNYAITVPNLTSNECLVKIQSTENSAWFDISDSPFSIVIPLPSISVNPSQRLIFGNEYIGFYSDAFPLLIKNIGTTALVVDSLGFGRVDSPFSVSGATLPFTIPMGDSLAINMIFTPQMEGSISDSLYIFNNSANSPVYTLFLMGIGEYVPPQAPSNVNITMDGFNAVITWDAVSQTIFNTPFVPDGYLIFYNDDPDPLIGTFHLLVDTPELSHTHLWVGGSAEHMFYRVVAYKHGDRGDTSLLHLVSGMSEAEVRTRLKYEKLVIKHE